MCVLGPCVCVCVCVFDSKVTKMSLNSFQNGVDAATVSEQSSNQSRRFTVASFTAECTVYYVGIPSLSLSLHAKRFPIDNLLFLS